VDLAAESGTGSRPGRWARGEQSYPQSPSKEYAQRLLLSGSQKQILADSFAAFAGHPAYNTGTLCADLHRFAFLLGQSDGEELFGESAP
jgi:hypothetical protein